MIIEGEYFSKIAYCCLIALTILDNFIHIDQLFLVFVFTSLLVYIGSIQSAKIFSLSTKSEIEVMKQKDAWLFPLFGSGVLFGLYLLFKFLNKDYVNILLHFYFTFLGSISIGALINGKIAEYPSFKPYSEKYCFTFPKIPFVNDKPVKVSQLEGCCYVVGSLIGLFYFFFKNWVLNNIFGCAFSIFGIENMMLGQYKIGLILLVLLFFYDIFWVFFTEVMVSVAKNLDGPIKLMFPKMLHYVDPIKDFNLIGLGDIVIPGIYVALMLRFDIIKFQRKNGVGIKIPFTFMNFRYFFITLIGYVLGIFTTLSVMVVFQHAQPALLYLVPGCLIPSTVTALITSDIIELWNFNEETAQEELYPTKKDN